MKYTFEIARTPERFNALANSPKIRPYVVEQGVGDFDVTPIWGPHCVGLLWPEGGFLFQKLDDCGLWEVHTLFEDSRHASQQVQEAAHFIFVRFCDKLTTRVPASNRRARTFAQATGMRDDFTVKQLWHGPEGLEDLHILTWRTEEWIAACADLEFAGHDVHEALEQSGFHTNHGEDPVHERYVGYVAECYRAGVPNRGIYYYNRWAISCGYEPIRFIDKTSAAFGNVKIAITPDGYEVSPCQSEP